jgi:hypothetical protein
MYAVTVNVTINNYKRNKDTKRKNKRNQFMIVSGLSYNQNDDQYAQGKLLTRRETMTTILLSLHEFSLSTGNGNYEALGYVNYVHGH